MIRPIRKLEKLNTNDMPAVDAHALQDTITNVLNSPQPITTSKLKFLRAHRNYFLIFLRAHRNYFLIFIGNSVKFWFALQSLISHEYCQMIGRYCVLKRRQPYTLKCPIKLLRNSNCAQHATNNLVSISDHFYLVKRVNETFYNS